MTCHSTRTHYSDSETTSLCSFSLMLRSYRRSNKYQFYFLWIDPIGARTHDIPHSRRVLLTIKPPMWFAKKTIRFTRKRELLQSTDLYILNSRFYIEHKTSKYAKPCWWSNDYVLGSSA